MMAAEDVVDDVKVDEDDVGRKVDWAGCGTIAYGDGQTSASAV